MLDLADILKKRIERFEKNPKEYLELKGKLYNKKWNDAVKCFQDRINKDRKKEKRPEIEFLPVRQKLVVLKEIDDLRWFYKQCLEYSYTKDKATGKRNTFSRGFWGATKIR